MATMLTYKVVSKHFLMLKFLLYVPDKNHIKMVQQLEVHEIKVVGCYLKVTDEKVN